MSDCACIFSGEARSADESFLHYQLRRTEQNKELRQKLKGRTIESGPGLNRKKIRQLIKTKQVKRLPRPKGLGKGGGTMESSTESGS